MYFPVVDSALDIPPFSTDLSQMFGTYAADMEQLEESDWPDFIRLNRLEQKTGKPKEVLLRALGEWQKALKADDPGTPLEWGEYLQFLASVEGPVSQGEFQVTREPSPPELSEYLDLVVLARRLREVRAEIGFTRVRPPSGPFRAPASRMGRLYASPVDWLPAVELRGEGTFLRFEKDRLNQWESQENVKARAAVLRARRQTPNIDPVEEANRTSPRFLLLHSFAHALMKQLSLSCGYSSAALRERLYSGFGTTEMAGVLVHTGSADSEGTLGGLVRQGREELLENTLREMIQSIAWCSSDPLCITGAITLSSPENLSACHACLLAPETSCQHFNLLLDRAMLVGTPDDPSLGFFQEYMVETR